MEHMVQDTKPAFTLVRLIGSTSDPHCNKSRLVEMIILGYIRPSYKWAVNCNCPRFQCYPLHIYMEVGLGCFLVYQSTVLWVSGVHQMGIISRSYSEPDVQNTLFTLLYHITLGSCIKEFSL